ncbi:MAG TPA: amino acid permease, partial [Myxococcota bacterium]
RSVVYPAGSTATSDTPLPLALAQAVSPTSALFAVLASLGIFGLVASFHGILIAASRALLELGRAGYAPRIVGTIHPTRHTPIAALVVNALIGAVALVTGRTGDIITISVFGALTLYVLSMASLFQLRRREPALARPYRTPGYPIVPAVALLLSLVCLIAMIVSNPLLAAIYAGILGVAWLAFVILKKRA